ncbi:unannotated protein [freshwater metagenome]|uniref:Unannotated protein n=1 Tax=freshwater metagenome TaxID=449393 RepID=A0A6J7NUT2_9ZZZZ
MIATSPATTPEAAPRLVAWPSRIFSVASHARPAAQVATKVLRNTTAAELSAAIWEPALNPNQPNHSSAAPIMTSVRLCGFIGVFGQPMRRPMTIARMRAAAPALMCTAVPPAKSMTPSL